MVSMRDHNIVAALHEPPLPIPLLRSERRRGCPQGGRGGGIGSWSQLMSKFFDVFALHEPERGVYAASLWKIESRSKNRGVLDVRTVKRRKRRAPHAKRTDFPVPGSAR